MLDSIKADARSAFLLGAGIIVLLFLFALYWVFKKDFQPLFTELQPEDAALMIQELEKISVDYKINEHTGTLDVPANEVHNTRLKLMGSDISLKGSVGYEIFDNSDFGMTEFAQKINYQRALEGELQRTIMSLEQVNHARVHLVMPDRELFKENTQEPTASITLLLKNGEALNPEQITGIQRLVSSSVQRLNENMVTITDHYGETLTQVIPASDKSLQVMPWQLKQKMNAESYLEDKIYKVMSKVFDTSKMSVSVNMQMNFSRIKKIEEKILSAEDGRAISREKESSVGNVSSKKGGQNITKETEYKMGKSVAEITESPGRINRLSVGVMLPVSLKEEKLEEIKRLIKVTAGIDEQRGDLLAIYAYDHSGEEGFQTKTVESVSDIQVLSRESLEDKLVLEKQISEVKNQKKVVLDDLQIVFDLIEKYLIYIVLFIVFLICIVFYLYLSSTRLKSKALSSKEREKVLMQIQHWLSEAN